MSLSNVEVTQRCTFECCYVSDIKSQSSPLNAHHYQFEATVINPKGYSDDGTVISFELLKTYMERCSFNGYFLYSSYDIAAKSIAEAFERYGVQTYSTDKVITAETLLELLVDRLCDIVNSYGLGTIVKEAKLRENASSFVTWKKEG